MNNNKFRRVSSVFLCIVFMLSLVACSGGTYSAMNATANDTDSNMAMIYDQFDGYKYTSMEFKKGEVLDIDIEVTTESGELEVYMSSDKDMRMFSYINPDQPINLQVEFPEDGTYRIFVSGKHSGSYNISWNKLSN